MNSSRDATARSAGLLWAGHPAQSAGLDPRDGLTLNEKMSQLNVGEGPAHKHAEKLFPPWLSLVCALCPFALCFSRHVSSAILPISRHTSSCSSMLAHCPLRSPDDVAAEHSDERPPRACNWGAVAAVKGFDLHPSKWGCIRACSQFPSGGVRSPPQMRQQNVTPVSSTALFIPLF